MFSISLVDYMESKMTTWDDVKDSEKCIKVLDKGFCRLVDSMGNDQSIVQAARVSYGDGTKSVREDRGLIRYLFKHKHCYHPSMQVLTISGWKRWDDCQAEETFLVPDPETRTYRIETLPIVSFDTDEDLYTFKNNRMSYKVTADHKMWFKGKYQKDFAKIYVQDMPKWGWFDPTSGYSLPGTVHGDGDIQYMFIGFYLGDGSHASTNRISFHLKKSIGINL
jgi:hypothetical protein